MEEKVKPHKFQANFPSLFVFSACGVWAGKAKQLPACFHPYPQGFCKVFIWLPLTISQADIAEVPNLWAVAHY